MIIIEYYNYYWYNNIFIAKFILFYLTLWSRMMYHVVARLDTLTGQFSDIENEIN